MNPWWLVSYVGLWLVVLLLLGFLLPGALRAWAWCAGGWVSKRYETFVTPFAFLIDEQGVIASKGIVNNGQHIDFVLSGAGEAARNGQHEAEPATTAVGAA